MTQFLSCRFRPGDHRTYTYRNDGDPVAVGTFVEVETFGGISRVEVVGSTHYAPTFICKPILRLSADQTP